MNDSLHFIVACFMKIPLPTLVFQLMHRTWRLCPQTLMECTCRVGLGKYMGGRSQKDPKKKEKILLMLILEQVDWKMLFVANVILEVKNRY